MYRISDKSTCICPKSTLTVGTEILSFAFLTEQPLKSRVDEFAAGQRSQSIWSLLLSQKFGSAGRERKNAVERH